MNETDRVIALLNLAAHNLNEMVRPELKGDARFASAMIARAIDVSARSLEQRDELHDRMLADLQELLPFAERNNLHDLQKTLIRNIRAGRHDGERGAALRGVMRSWVRARLQICDPTYLARLGVNDDRDGSGP